MQGDVKFIETFPVQAGTNEAVQETICYQRKIDG